MTGSNIFDRETVLPDPELTAQGKKLLGFDTRYAKVRDQLRLMLSAGELAQWNRKHHSGRLALCDLVAEQYPLAIFHGDVGTGKTATAEAIANRLVAESGAEDSVLFKLSNRVRGSGRVGEMGSLIAEAFSKIAQAAGKGRRAILIIDEGDSLGANRAQEHSHHEDKVGVNTLIQSIDDLRKFGGRVLVIVCTNRLSVLDPALRRRAAVAEEFTRPNTDERRELLEMDMVGLNLDKDQIDKLVTATGPLDGQPGWTYSDIRTRLYPAAMAKAFPDKALTFDHLSIVASVMLPSPVMEDR